MSINGEREMYNKPMSNNVPNYLVAIWLLCGMLQCGYFAA